MWGGGESRSDCFWPGNGTETFQPLPDAHKIPIGCGAVRWTGGTARERAAGLCCLLKMPPPFYLWQRASEFPLRYTASAGLTPNDNMQSARIFVTGETRAEWDRDKGALGGGKCDTIRAVSARLSASKHS